MSLVAAAFVLPSQLASADLDFEQISIGSHANACGHMGWGSTPAGSIFFFTVKFLFFILFHICVGL